MPIRNQVDNRNPRGSFSTRWRPRSCTGWRQVRRMMRKFSFRTPRFPVDFPVSVTQDCATRPGRCLEISVEGMKVELEDQFAPNSDGSVEIRCDELQLEIHFRVIYSESNVRGLEFTFRTGEQRKAVSDLVSRLSAPRPCRSLVPSGQRFASPHPASNFHFI